MANDDTTTRHIIDLERHALARWCRGDPSGFIEISVPDIVYFDPFVEQRINGRERLSEYYELLRGKIEAEQFELIHPHVQLLGDAAVLTYNFVSRAATGGVQRWNCTEMYHCDPEGWRLVQSHWSFTKSA
jgi:hypothetical protein